MGSTYTIFIRGFLEQVVNILLEDLLIFPIFTLEPTSLASAVNQGLVDTPFASLSESFCASIDFTLKRFFPGVSKLMLN